MSEQRVADLTLDQLRTIIREELERFRREMATVVQPREVRDTDLSDFPVDDLGAWPKGLSLRREEMYGDDGR